MLTGVLKEIILASYDDDASVYTPAWQENYTRISAATVIQFAREWYRTAEATNGKCMIIIGTGVNQWYHSNLIYRAAALSADLYRLYRCERRRHESLCRAGKACSV